MSALQKLGTIVRAFIMRWAYSHMGRVFLWRIGPSGLRNWLAGMMPQTQTMADGTVKEGFTALAWVYRSENGTCGPEWVTVIPAEQENGAVVVGAQSIQRRTIYDV